MNLAMTNYFRWVARATSPCRQATGPAEWRRLRSRPATPLSSVRHSHSGRQVADRHRLVACATSLKGDVAASSSHYELRFGFTQHGGQL